MIWATLIVLFIGIIYPAYIILTYKKLIVKIESHSGFRVVEYKQMISILWILTSLILLVVYTTGIPTFKFYSSIDIWAIALTVLIVVFALVQYSQAKVSSENVGGLRNTLKDVYHYLPGSKTELIWFKFLSVSAGVCEEIIYRLFLFEYINQFLPLLVAILLANVIFAFSHFGTGMRNMIGALILGLLFSAIYYFTGNIWIAMLLHTVIDLNSGILGFRLKNFLSTQEEEE